MPSPNEYRLIDEGAKPLRAYGSWNPFGLFCITIFFAPVGAVMSWLNWGRLGFRDKQKAWLLPTVLLVAAPYALIYAAVAMHVALAGNTKSSIDTLLVICLAYPYLVAQRPIFEVQRRRGERTVAAWWLWLLAAVLFAGQISYAVLVKLPRDS